MAQAAAELNPFASPRHYLGAELRAWRQLRGYSLAQLGRIVHVSGDLLGKIEKAQRRPAEELIERCDDVLDAAGILCRLHKLTRQCTAETADQSKLDAANVGVRVQAWPTLTARRSAQAGTTTDRTEVVDIAAARRRRIAVPVPHTADSSINVSPTSQRTTSRPRATGPARSLRTRGPFASQEHRDLYAHDDCADADRSRVHIDGVDASAFS